MSGVWAGVKFVLMVVGVAAVVFAIFLGILLWNFSKPAQLQDEMRDVPITNESANTLEQNLQEFVRPIKDDSPPGTQTELIVTEEQVSSELTRLMEQYESSLGLPVDVDKVQVNFIPGSVNVVASARGSFLLLEINVAARGSVDVQEEDNHLVAHWTISQLDLGNTPDMIKDLIREKMQDKMQGSRDIPDSENLRLKEFGIVQLDGKYVLRIVGVKQALPAS